MTREFDLTPEQAKGLRELMDESNQAQQVASLAKDRLTVGFSMVVRGFGVTEARNPVLEGVRLTVTLPDEEPKA